jgi:PAS domain S-box-containing protein
MGVLARQQRMTQEALRKTLREAQDATARFQSFFDGSPEMLAVVDREGQLILANRRWRSEVGASNDGQPGTQALVPANAWTVGASAATMHEHWQAALQGRVSEQALSTTRPDGSVQELEMSFAPLVDHTGDVVGAYTSIRDVGLLRKRQQDQANARRLESIGRLAGGIAHDFNNIITGIQGYAQLLALALPPDHEGLQDLREIVGAGDRAANLTRQLLAFARSQVIEPKCVDLAPLVDQMASLLRRVIGDERNFAIEIDDNVWPVLVDPGQLEQVLMNLVINARDATKEDGKIVLSAKNEVVDADNAGIFEIQAGAYIVVSVQDDGIGMPPDVRARIFEPFFTTKGPGKGTGLGLATVEGIVRQLGGCIRVESEPGNGTTFRAYFPRAMAGAAEPIEPGREAAKVRPASETILLVEDDPSLRALNARILEKSGFRVLRFADGSQALRISELELSRVAVLITDVVMQETNGFELANQLRQRVPQLPVLFVSGYVDHEVLRQFAGEGEVTLLGKPFAPDELVAKVGQILGAASSSDRRSMPDVHAVRASIRAQCTRPT